MYNNVMERGRKKHTLLSNTGCYSNCLYHCTDVVLLWHVLLGHPSDHTGLNPHFILATQDFEET